MPRLEVKRQMSPDDIAVVSGLLEASERADDHHALGDHAWLDLVQGGRTGFAGLVAWEPGHNHPVAYAQVSRGNDSWALELVIHPHHRYEAMSIGSQLLHAALGDRRSRGRRSRALVGVRAHRGPRGAGRRGRAGARSPAAPDASPAADRRTAARDAAVRRRPGRGGLARRQQPGLRRPSRAGRLGPRHVAGPGEGALVRPRRVPAPRARRPAGRLLLDQGPRRPRRRCSGRST